MKKHAELQINVCWSCPFCACQQTDAWARMQQEVRSNLKACEAATDHFGFDRAIAFASFRKHVPLALTKVAQSDRF